MSDVNFIKALIKNKGQIHIKKYKCRPRQAQNTYKSKTFAKKPLSSHKSLLCKVITLKILKNFG